jgi:hypothetical protein
MAALAWLYRIAVTMGEKDDFLYSLRPGAGQARLDSRALWDWYYVQLIREDENEDYAALRRLSQTGEAQAQWLFLNALSNRKATTRARHDSDEDETPPLLADELEQVLTCYRSVAQKHPEWLTDGPRGGLGVVKNVLEELKRAGHTDEADKIYRDVVATAGTWDSRVTALQLAAARSDFETALALFDALSQRATSDTIPAPAAWAESETIDAMTQMMSKRGEAGAHDDVLLLLDRCLAALSRRPAPATHARPAQRGSDRQSYAAIWRGEYQQHESLDFPHPNRYIDQNCLNVLRQAYDIHEQNDLVSDLVAHCRDRAATAPAPERLWWRFALADLSWWTGEKEQAVVELKQAAQQAFDDPWLQLDLVDVLSQLDRHAEALALCDAFVPLNHEQLQQREWLALRLAVRTGQVARARRAAERLVGLRLDAELQIELSARMRELGMHDLAEAILGRARRQAGNRTSVLVNLLDRHEADQNSELLHEVAYQILRLSAPPSQPGSRSDSDESRQQALAVLARSGRIQDMIERVETQIKASPESVRLFQALAELHLAAGDKTQHLQVLRRMAELRPDDMNLLLQVGRRIEATGKPADALDLYATIAAKDPALFARYQQHICQAFQQARKLDVLAGLVDQIDLKRIDSQNLLHFAMHVLFQDEKQHDAAVGLFRRIWTALPEQRARLLASTDDDTVLMLPEVYEFSRDAILPRQAAELGDPWSGFDQVRYHHGSQQSELVHLVEIALKQNRLPELRDDVQAALLKHPEWSGGKALVAVIHARMQRPERAVPFVEQLLSDSRQRLPATLCSVLGQELENHDASRAIAYRLYEDLFDRPDFSDFDWAIFQRLTGMYQKQGEATKGRDLVLKMSRVRRRDNRRGSSAAEYRMQMALFAGFALQHCGFPLEAVRMFRDVFDDEVLLQKLEKENDGYQLSESRNYYQQALRGLGKQDGRQAIAALLERAPADDSRSERVFNLLLEKKGQCLERRELYSAVCGALRSVANTPELQAFARAQASEVAQQHADDLAAHILACLAAAGDDNSDLLQEAVRRLVGLVERTPLETLSSGTRANARQRALAARQVGLWLVARECLKRSELEKPGELLAARALEAARRQSDRSTRVVLLREWGQILFDRGNREAAAARWAEMLDEALASEGAGGGKAFGAPAEDSQLAASNDPSAAPLTISQFNEAIEIASLAGKRGLGALSLRAARDALSAGPPVQEGHQGRHLGMRAHLQHGRAQGVWGDVNVFPHVEAALLPLSLAWSRAQLPAADQFDVLAAAVLPIGRPAEIFLYATRADPNDRYQLAWRQGRQQLAAALRSGQNNEDELRSLGQRLAALAVQAGRADELRRRIAERQDQPLAKLPALILLAQLALEAGDDAQTLAALQELHRHLEVNALASSAELACHVALPALARESLSVEALALVELAAKRLSAAPQADDELCSNVLMRLARRHLERGEIELARDKFVQLVEFQKQKNSQQNSLHGMFRMSMSDRGSQWRKIADEYLRAGYLREALDAWQQEFQEPALDESSARVESPSADTLSAVARLALELPAAERYKLLKSWTMPERNLRQVRVLGAFSNTNTLPEAFRTLAESHRPRGARANPAVRFADRPNAAGVGLGRDSAYAGLPQRDFLCTAALLIDAARQAGQTGDLIAALHERAVERVPGAAALEVAARITAGDADQIVLDVQKFAADLSVRFPAPGPDVDDEGPDDMDLDDQSAGDQHEDNVSWAEYLLVRECLSHDSLRDAGEQALKLWSAGAKQNAGGVPVMNLSENLAAVVAARGAAGAGPWPVGPDLALWNWSTGAPRPQLDDGSVAPRWLVHEGHLVRLSAAAFDSLHFKYPLVGDFEFSVEMLTSASDTANVSFGGLPLDLRLERYESAGRLEVDAMNGNSRQRALAEARTMPRFHRVQLRSDSRRVQLFIDGQLVYDEELSAFTCPFLSLNATRYGQSVFRNLTLRGDLRIPREITLTEGDLLDGWSPDRFGESRQERKQTARSNYRDEYDMFEASADDSENDGDDESPDFQWWAENGVIHAREPDFVSTDPAGESLLAYERPLVSGESLRYEFYYEPEKFEVHPALGQLVFLLQPAGGRLHWLTDQQEFSGWHSLPADNAVDEPSCRRGPQPLPLKPGDWNVLHLSIAGDVVDIELNGVEIYRRPLEPTNDRKFGLFRDPGRHAVRVRSVVLSGEWPREISAEQSGDLLAETAPRLPVAGNTTRVELIGEQVLAMNWEQVLQRAASLPAAGRYELLRDWVMPGASRTTFRLSGGFSPTLQPPSGTAATRPAGTRQITGGDFAVPALDLIEVARELKKLEELENSARAAPAKSDLEQRGRLAFLTLLAAARLDAKTAATSLAQMASYSEAIPRNASESERWPELLAATVALRMPELAKPAVALLDGVIPPDDAKRPPSSWDRSLISFRNRLEALAQPRKDSAPLRQWAQVSHATAESLSRGALPPQWLIRRGEARHVAGLEHDQLYFQSPLRGDFEVTCRLSAGPRQDVQVGYGGFRIELFPALDKYTLLRLGVAEHRRIEPPLADVGETYDYRLAVRDGVCTIFVNGVRVHQELLGAGCDPWLNLHCAGMRNGAVRDLRITGDPSIPENLELLGHADLTGWITDYYEPEQPTNESSWKKMGSWLVSERQRDLPGAHRQHVIRYHRPLLENGEIEYEFYYEPGKVLVHPALDRLTFLIEPGGVRIHWLTDAQFDRTGRLPDNAGEEPANRRGPNTLPLQERNWNRLNVALTGNEVTVSVNAVEVYQRPLEASNQRTFGLFHYAEETEVRVRNVTYRGDWPRRLPAFAGQELAADR